MKIWILPCLLFCLLIFKPSTASESDQVPKKWDLVRDGCVAEDKNIDACRNTQGAEKKTCSYTKTTGITYSSGTEQTETKEESKEISKLKSHEGTVGVSASFLNGILGANAEATFREEVNRASGKMQSWSSTNTVEASFTQGTEKTEEIIAPEYATAYITARIVTCGPFKIFLGTDVKTEYAKERPDVETEKPKGTSKECDEVFLKEGGKGPHETEKNKYYECMYGKRLLQSCPPGTEFQRSSSGCT
uniref:Chitin-binding type-2 domain-containing protein n=1 Tax=Panagrolaimus superbus TaxID=310955 RepID=A0A914YQX1_9BILA